MHGAPPNMYYVHTHAPCTMLQAPYSMYHLPCTMHHSPCITHHAPYTICHRACIMFQTPSPMHQAPCDTPSPIHCTTCTMHESPYNVHCAVLGMKHVEHTNQYSLCSMCYVPYKMHHVLGKCFKHNMHCSMHSASCTVDLAL